VLKELNQNNKKTHGDLTGQTGGCPGRLCNKPRIGKHSKIEIIQFGATLLKHLGNPFGSTWIQKLITTKLRQKNLEHYLWCQAQDVELGVLGEERTLSILIFKLAKVFTFWFGKSI